MFPSRHVSYGDDQMINSHVTHAWQFECLLPSGTKLSSWFYADTEEDATDRIKSLMGAKLISIKEIDDPLETAKKQAESEKAREALAKKKQAEQSVRQDSKKDENNN